MKVTCGVFIVDAASKILACHPTNASWKIWSIPKGLLDINETELQAAIREVEEETSFKINENSNLVELPYNQYLKDKKIKPFIYRYDKIINISDLKCDSMVTKNTKVPFPEVDAYKMFTIEEAVINLHHSQSYYLKEYINYFK